MGLNTDFNQSPYFDDFDETKNYHRVLFKPAVAVQARELTQLQTILQNQIERFGNNILVEGTIIQGGNFVEEKNLPYVKIRDIAYNNLGNEVATDVNLYTGYKAVGLTTGVEAIVVATEFGLESQAPDMSTLFVKYIKSSLSANDTNISTFSSTEEIQLYEADSNGLYTLQRDRVTVAGALDTVTDKAIGKGYGVRCGDGIIYQKGHFIRFENALTIVSKYSNEPTDVVVGFITDESIIDSNADSSLLDNANGFNNENAPGADRLQLTPTLAVKTIAEAKADDAFFAIQEYQNGKVVRRRLSTQYNQIEKSIEQRTVEESGNYVVNRFPIRVVDTANLESLDVVVGAGLAYVEGKRVELLNDITITVPEANTSLKSPIQSISTNYGSYVITSSYKGSFDFTTFEEIDLKNSSNTVIGTARVRAITRDPASGYRIYLTQITMGANSKFEDTRVLLGDNGTANTALVSGKTVLVDQSFDKSIFPVGKSFIKNVDQANTAFIYRASTTESASTTTITITLGAAADYWPYTAGGTLNSDERKEIMIIANAQSSNGLILSGEVVELTAASIDGTGKVLTGTLAKNPGGALSLTAYYNVERTPAGVNTKTLETLYVKIFANTHPANTTGTYCLGVPDGYEIDAVWKANASVSNTTFDGYPSNTSVSTVTSYFKLDSGQNEKQYGLSYMRKKSGLTIGANDKILVKLRAFKNTSNGHFFTVNSYTSVIDDVSEVLPSDKIRTENIPVVTASNGTKYYLRDVIDVRPYASNTAAYAATASAATINPSANLSFSGILYPAPNKTIQTTYDYYVGRNDLVVIDRKGEFSLIEGTPAESPTWPQDPAKGMVLARLSVPPYPTLSAARANAVGKSDYGVGVSVSQTRRYTMKDIGGIDSRLQNLEYYTSLSLLETKAKDLTITDSNGLDRFKNGIFVDNFDTFYLADVNGGEHKAAIDPSARDVHPSFRQYNLKMTYKNGSNIDTFSKDTVATLPKRNYLLESVSQPYATNIRSCTTSYYSYEGKMGLYPEYDSGPDMVKAPDISINIDLATPFIEFTEALNEITPLQKSSSSSITNYSNPINQILGIGTKETKTVTTSLTTSLGITTPEVVGDFVTDVNFSPYMRSQQIRVSAVGLRPNTRFYFFFDGVDVNSNVVPGEMGVEDSTSIADIVSAGAAGAAVKSDANGILYAIFTIPESTFYVGDRVLEIMDIDTYANKDAASSTASAKYSAFNFSVQKSTLSTLTRSPSFNITSRTSYAVTRTGSDPIAQTFIIDKDLSNDTDVFVTKVDLYFASKSKVGAGVGVQIREVQNGIPTGIALPFSSVHKRANQVNVSTTTGDTTVLQATTFTFDAPVALKTDTEYALIVAPDGNDPDYRVWIARTGQLDVVSKLAITQDSNAGVLFTSTNNKTWTPYQNENLRFDIYAAKFTDASGTVTLKNYDHEFFAIEDVNGKFKTTEQVFINKASYLTGSVTITKDSAIITGSSTNFTTDYNVGNHIIVKVASNNFEVMKIKTIQSATQMTAEAPSKQTAAGVSTHFTSPVGDLVYVNIADPATMILEGSNARFADSFVFSDGDDIIGGTSNATATITNVKNLPISYIQPQIYRSNFSNTRTSLYITRLWNNSTASNPNKRIGFGDTTYLTDDTYYIRSKSKQAGTGFELTVQLDNTSNQFDTSPVVDIDISSATFVQYISDDSGVSNKTNYDNIIATEKTGLGVGKAKHVTRVIELANGLDAEELRVFLTAYKPNGTDIIAYAKFQSATDVRNIKDIEWTKLDIKAETNSTSSLADRYDYRELEFSIPLDTDVTNLSNGGGAKLISDTIAYKDTDGALYRNFKYFALKVVMIADGHNVVPRLKDIRAIAVS